MIENLEGTTGFILIDEAHRSAAPSYSTIMQALQNPPQYPLVCEFYLLVVLPIELMPEIYKVCRSVDCRDGELMRPVYHDDAGDDHGMFRAAGSRCGPSFRGHLSEVRIDQAADRCAQRGCLAAEGL